MHEVAASLNLCETSCHVAGPKESTAKGAQEVLPPEKPENLRTTPSEVREKLTGPRRDLSKMSLSTRPVFEEQKGETHTH